MKKSKKENIWSHLLFILLGFVLWSGSLYLGIRFLTLGKTVGLSLLSMFLLIGIYVLYYKTSKKENPLFHFILFVVFGLVMLGASIYIGVLYLPLSWTIIASMCAMFVVMALYECGAEREKKKRHPLAHFIFFIILGLALFGGTIYIGIRFLTLPWTTLISILSVLLLLTLFECTRPKEEKIKETKKEVKTSKKEKKEMIQRQRSHVHFRSIFFIFFGFILFGSSIALGIQHLSLAWTVVLSLVSIILVMILFESSGKKLCILKKEKKNREPMLRFLLYILLGVLLFSGAIVLGIAYLSLFGTVILALVAVLLDALLYSIDWKKFGSLRKEKNKRAIQLFAFIFFFSLLFSVALFIGIIFLDAVGTIILGVIATLAAIGFYYGCMNLKKEEKIEKGNVLTNEELMELDEFDLEDPFELIDDPDLRALAKINTMEDVEKMGQEENKKDGEVKQSEE